jgi:hypothetical protein
VNDNKKIKQMKRFLMILTAAICVGIGVNAKDGQGSCTVNNTNDYASVDFYKGGSGGTGNFTIVYGTSGDKPLASATVTITAEIYYGSWRMETLYDGTVYDVPANQTKTVNVKMPNYTDIRNIQVTVSNPVCK